MKTLGFENSNLESFGLENLGCFEKDFEVGLEVAIGRAGPGQQWAGPKPGRAKIVLTAQPALKTGPVGPNSLFKAKKNSGGPGRAEPYRAGPYRAGPNLARFFSGQKFNGPARP